MNEVTIIYRTDYLLACPKEPLYETNYFGEAFTWS